MRSLLDSAIRTVVTLVVLTVLVRWSWNMLAPYVPGFVVVLGILGFGVMLVRRR